MPYYLELSTPTTNYTSFITWNNKSIVSFNLFNNDRLIANGSGLYQYDSLKRISLNLTDIYPKHIGDIFVDYNGNLTINAVKLLGGEFFVRIDRLSDWKHGQIEIKAQRTFFFFKEDFALSFYYDMYQSLFNLTSWRGQNSKFQWIFSNNNSHVNHLLNFNTSLMEFNHHTEVI